MAAGAQAATPGKARPRSPVICGDHALQIAEGEGSGAFARGDPVGLPSPFPIPVHVRVGEAQPPLNSGQWGVPGGSQWDCASTGLVARDEQGPAHAPLEAQSWRQVTCPQQPMPQGTPAHLAKGPLLFLAAPVLALLCPWGWPSPL